MYPKQESIGKILFHLVLLVASSGYLVSAFSLGAPVVEAQLKPSFFPLLIGTLAVIFSAVLMHRALKESRQDANNGSAAKSDRLSYLIIGSTALYVLTFTLLGYLLSSVLYVFAIMIIFSSRERWIEKLAIAAVIVGLGYLVFEQLFGVRLPTLWE